MKKILTLAAGICLAGVTHSDGQVRGFRDVLIGPVAGGGVNWVNNLTGAEKFMPSGYAGLNIIAYSSEYFAWGGQLTVSSEGYRLNYYGNKEIVRPEYLRVPLKGYFFMGDRYSRIRPYIDFGPSFAVKISESRSSTVIDKEINKPAVPLPFEKYDLGLDAGIGMNMKTGERTSLDFGLDYYKGLVDVIDDQAKHKNVNQNVNLSVTLLLRIND